MHSTIDMLQYENNVCLRPKADIKDNNGNGSRIVIWDGKEHLGL